MGADIHLFVERRNRSEYDPETYNPDEPDENPWLVVPGPVETCWLCKGTGKRHDEDKACYWCDGKGEHEKPWYSDRNYSLFAILADVRNGVGFAGIRTGSGFVPICAPRGLPRDGSDQAIASSWRWDVDGHSHSWLTVQELLDYDWTQTTKRTGVVDVVGFKTWLDTGAPNTWAGEIRGSSIEHVDNHRMVEIVSNPEAHGFRFVPFTNEHWGETIAAEPLAWPDEVPEERRVAHPAHSPVPFHTRIDWEQTYEQCCTGFLKVLREKLVNLGDPRETRIVFWFDN